MNRGGRAPEREDMSLCRVVIYNVGAHRRRKDLRVKVAGEIAAEKCIEQAVYPRSINASARYPHLGEWENASERESSATHIGTEMFYLLSEASATLRLRTKRGESFFGKTVTWNIFDTFFPSEQTFGMSFQWSCPEIFAHNVLQNSHDLYVERNSFEILKFR